MQQSMTSFSISFVFKGREFRSCDWINFLSECAIDWKKNRFFEPKSYSKKNNPNINTPAWNLSSLIEFYLFRTFQNKQENFTFLPDRLPFLSNTSV